jgi:membrane-bound serine protease (ClpP class)
MIRYRASFLFLMAFVVMGFLLACPSACAQQTPLVLRLELRDTIQPVSAGRLERALEKARAEHAAALLVDLDTPGGLLDSTRTMVGGILSSPVPVIVYISPSGARGGSAGFFLLESADIAAMAPGTNAGAAHPVLSSGVPDDTLKQKMENDAAAFLRSYVGRHGRNAQVAEEAVRNSKAYSADEAKDQHLIDIIASSDRALLASLDGKTIQRVDGSGNPVSFTLHLRNAELETLEPTVREQLLGYLANPNLALLLLVGGALLIYLEFNVPGTVVPGALGTVMVLLAVFSLDLLPIRHTAVLLLLAAVVLFVMELKFASHGVLAIAAIASLAIGTLTLVDAPIPEMAIQPAIAIALCVAFGGITLLLLRLAVRARKNKALTGLAALVGSTATAMEPLWPATVGQEVDGSERSIGHVVVQGEIWQAFSSEPLPVKSAVRVTGFRGDVLEVQPVIPTEPSTPR